MIRRAAVIALVAAAPALAAEQSFPVGAFDRIALGGSPEVTVTTGTAVGVRAVGDRKALDRLEIRVEGGVLKIGSKHGGWTVGWGDYGKVRIAVGVPMVRGVEVGGSGSVAVDRVRTADFAADVGGSGNVQIATLDTGRARFNVGGSGNIAASGRCSTAEMNVGGSGSLRLAGLKCATLNANVAGSGDIDANASQTAAVSIAGSGDVHVAGTARCSVSTHGSGRATCGV